MQKKNLFLSLLVLGVLIATPLILAADYGSYSITSDILNPIKNFFSTFIKVLFIADFNEPALYSRLLLFLVVFLVIQKIVAEKIMGGSKLSWLLSAVVAILGIRILPASIINLVTLPYGTLAVVVTSLVPLIILWYFTKGVPKPFRLFSWVLAAISFIVLAVLRYSIIGGAIWIYIIAALISLIIPFIQNFIKSKEIETASEKMGSTRLRADIARVGRELDDLIKAKAEAQATNDIGSVAKLQADITRLERERKSLEKSLRSKTED